MVERSYTETVSVTMDVSNAELLRRWTGKQDLAEIVQIIVNREISTAADYMDDSDGHNFGRQ